MSTILSKLQQYPRSLLIIVSLGLIVRTLFVSLHDRPLISDEKEYDYLAFNLTTNGTYAYNDTPTAYRPVGYPAFVSFVYTIAGAHPTAVKFIQVLLDSFTILLLFHLFSWAGSRVQLAASAFWALFPPAILYANFLMSETLFTFFLVLALYFLQKFDEQKNVSRLVLGILFGFLLLLKPNFLLFLLFLPYLFYKFNWHYKKGIVLLVGVLITIAPWLVRNYLHFKTLTLSTNGGINLLIGNNPNATGAYSINFPPEALQGAGNEVEADRFAFNYAIHHIVEHPTQFAINGAKKLAHFISSEGGLLVWAFHDKPEDSSIQYAAKYASIPIPLQILVNLPFFLLMLLGIAGFIASPRDLLWQTTFLLLLSWLITHVVVFGGSRFHFPLMPFIAGFAAYAFTEYREWKSRFTVTNKIIVAALMLVCALVWSVEAWMIFHG